MKLAEILTEQILLEGGAAIKGAQKITQVEARHVTPDIIAKLAKVTSVDAKLIASSGSGGKKPNDDDLSGDIDILIQTTPGKIEVALPKLAFDGESYRIMRGINVFSFGYKVAGKLVQVDVIPVDDIEYAKWAYQAHEKDLKQGLKGSHRNELLFAVAKFANRNVLKKDDAGEPVEVERYYYDLSKGLMTGKQSRIGKKGKPTKSWSTIDKHLLTSNPDKIAEILLGKGVNAARASTYNGVLKAIMSPKFPYEKLRGKILETAKEGMKKKKLVLPADF